MNNRILIIDDDYRNTFALELLLKKKGFNCITSNNPLEGLEILKKELVSVVILDMMMPELDGYTFLKRVRNNINLNKLPIIAVTAQAMPKDKEKCLAAGANYYIPKPINIEDLINVLKTYQ